MAPDSDPLPVPADPIVGIDLGTTNSLVAYSDAAGPRVLAAADGSRLLPSVVHVGPDGVMTLGAAARRLAVAEPTRTLYSVKRLMGLGWDAAQPELAHLAYRVVPTPADERAAGAADLAWVEVDGVRRSPQEISALILRALRERASHALGVPVRRAVVTVPANFDDAQRQATRDAGKVAGLEVVRIVNEPTAAALAYGLGERGPSARRVFAGALRHVRQPTARPAGAQGEKPPVADAPGSSPRLIAVYDLGGGTFDVSILRLEQGVFEVVASDGDTHLGGDDVDRLIMDLLLGGVGPITPTSRQALRDAAEAAKVRLSQEPRVTVELTVTRADGQAVPLRRELSQAELERLAEPWLARTVAISASTLRQAGVTAEQVTEVVLVGGSTRMPMVKRAVERLFGRPGYDAIDPDEVVALGAAVQASILAGVRRDVLLLDVAPLSLGVETMGGGFGKLILKNTAIPCRATELFSTFVDGQTQVAFNVLQGERELAQDCRSLGRFVLTGVPPMPAGLPKIEVTFLVDANGVLSVSAVEARSGARAGIQVVPAHGLTRQQVDRLEQEALAHAGEDMVAQRLITLRLHAQRDTLATQRNLSRVGDQLPEPQRARLGQRLAELQAFLAAPAPPDADAFHAALDALNHDPAATRLAELAITEALREQSEPRP